MNWLKAGVGSLFSLSPIQQIACWCIVLLLGSTLVLGGLLKRSYEANGKLSDRVVQLTKDVKERDNQLKLAAKSSEITDNSAGEAVNQKQGIRQATVETLQKLCKSKGAKDAKANVANRDAVLSAESDSLLREQYSKVQAGVAP